MSTTSTDLINETYSYLYAGTRDPFNKVSGAVDASQTTIQLTYDLGAARAGAVLAVDLELWYVWEVTNEQTKTLVVERGYLGSTPATHTAGTMCTVNPKFPAYNVLNAINAELDDLSANGLFRTATISVTYSASIQGYDLTAVTDLLEVLQVKYDEPGPAKLWPEIKSYKLRRASDGTDFASGNALVVYEAGQPGSAVRITYAAPFTKFTALGQAITITGLPTTAYDIPPMGAAYRMQSVREGQVKFNESQPATRRGDEVGSGAQLMGARGLQQIRRDRIRMETSRLRKLWPNRRRVPASV